MLILLVVLIVLMEKTFNALECEVGRNKATYQTDYDASNAHPSSLSVDGDLNTYSLLQGLNRTTVLRIDLGQEYTVTRIVISNHYSSSDTDKMWLRSLDIGVSNEIEIPLTTALYHWLVNDYVIPMSLTMRQTKRGRYVHVIKNRNVFEPLIIAEINIYALFTTPQAGEECEVAVGKKVSQKSTLGIYKSSNAIDDRLDTYSETNPSEDNIKNWLQVDLFESYLIVQIVVSNVNSNSAAASIFLRAFAVFVRQTNETNDAGVSAFGSTSEEIKYFDFNRESPSIVFIKPYGELGRYVTVVKQGATAFEELVIGDLAVFAKIGVTSLTTSTTTSPFVLPISTINNGVTSLTTSTTTGPFVLPISTINNGVTILTTSTTSFNTTSGPVVLPISTLYNATCENDLLQYSTNYSILQQKVINQEIEKIVIGVVVGVLAIIVGAILGFLCGYKCQKKSVTEINTEYEIPIAKSTAHDYESPAAKSTAHIYENPEDVSITPTPKHSDTVIDDYE